MVLILCEQLTFNLYLVFDVWVFEFIIIERVHN